MSWDQVYVPVFCPCCGYNLNQPGDDDLPPPNTETVSCGWCHGRHTYERVKQCRKLARMSERALFEGTIHGLLDLRSRASGE